MSKPSDNDLPVAKDLTESYRTQIEEIMREEALRRISETQSPEELERLNSLSLVKLYESCLLYTSPSPRDAHESRMPSSA